MECRIRVLAVWNPAANHHRRRHGDGSYPITAKVTDASGHNATATLNLIISSTVTTPPSSYTGFDGPAELPRIYIQTAMSNTPAPGSTTTVQSGGDLQSALNSANCGNTILFAPEAKTMGQCRSSAQAV